MIALRHDLRPDPRPDPRPDWRHEGAAGPSTSRGASMCPSTAPPAAWRRCRLANHCGHVDLPAPLLKLAHAQSGIVTRRQILASGLPLRDLKSALGQRFRLVLPGVVLLDPGLPNLDQRLVAAQLYAGPNAWLAGTTAAAIHKLPHAPSLDELRRVEMLVPAHADPATSLGSRYAEPTSWTSGWSSAVSCGSRARRALSSMRRRRQGRPGGARHDHCCRPTAACPSR